MENVKRKRREVVTQNYGNKLGRKPQKKTEKKTKRKENIKTLIAGHKCSELTAQTIGAKAPRVKDRQRIQGMFFKGLRTEFVARETLNEVNEARKREDINRIIDIGKVFLQRKKKKKKKTVFSRRAGKGVTARSDCRKVGKKRFSDDSTDSEREFQRFSSPISLPSSRARVPPPKDQDRTSVTRKKVDLEKELRSFSLKYEAVVGALLLLKIPSEGVLEDAFAALKNLRRSHRPESVPVTVEERKVFAFSPEKEDYPKDEVSPFEDFLSLVEGDRFPEGFEANPMENVFIMSPLAAPNNSPHLIICDNDDEDKSEGTIEFHAKDFQKPIKELSIATPPIHFYRRNMF